MRKKKKLKKKFFPKTQLPCLRILKSASCLLNNGSYLIMAYMYCSEEECGFPVHRWEGRVISKEELEKELHEMSLNFGKEWKWPGIENFQIKFNGTIMNRQGHKWLSNRMKLAKPWNEFYESLKFHKKDGWPDDDYHLHDEDQTPFSFDDNEEMFAGMVGENFSRTREKEEDRYANIIHEKIVEKSLDN